MDVEVTRTATSKSSPEGAAAGAAGGGYATAEGLEWWRNAAEQSTVVTTAKKPSATASDIPATARSSASWALWSTKPSAIVLAPLKTLVFFTEA